MMTRRLGLCLAFGLAAAPCGAGVRAADGGTAGVRLLLAEPLPFSAEEIMRAVEARLALTPNEPGADVVVMPAPAALLAAGAAGLPTGELLVGPREQGGVRVGWRDRVVYVPIGERLGAPAARVVALVIADLAAGELAPPAGASVTVARAADGTPGATSSPWSAPAPAPARLTLAGGLAKGMRADEPACFDLEADLAGPGWRRLRFGAALGLVLIPHQSQPAPDGYSFTGGVVRLVAVWRTSLWELLAGPFVSPYSLAGSSSHVGVLAGGSVGARVAPMLSPRLRLVVGLRADAYANRIHATWTFNSGFATPRVAAALTVGVAWELGS